jgi:hypothetical protein
VKHTNVQIYYAGASPQGWMFLELSHTQPILGRLVNSPSDFS